MRRVTPSQQKAARDLADRQSVCAVRELGPLPAVIFGLVAPKAFGRFARNAYQRQLSESEKRTLGLRNR